jgi:hypothetical protein
LYSDLNRDVQERRAKVLAGLGVKSL